ncbi:hypothetical protein [Salaquimonas pukyongi]|uniref:hypothetical protein n=1 Tax=Salaquimonas pukyongi TaxID=2712698 RepID=UPI0013BE9B12|nr:hypothetical protein [Salaquimonas pukyongi]
MRTQARMRENYEREKAGLPPKSAWGCSVVLAAFVAGTVALWSGTADAAESWTTTQNRTFVSNAGNASLTTVCDDGQGIHEPSVSFYLKGDSRIRPANPLWGIEVWAGEKQIYNTTSRFGETKFGWGTLVETKYILAALRHGSKLVFDWGRHAEDRTVFTLKGSADALDRCFNVRKSEPAYATSFNDIVGLKTGASFSAVSKRLSAHMPKNRTIVSDGSATFYGETIESNVSVHFDRGVEFINTNYEEGERIKVALSPDPMGKRVLTITRTLDYETDGPRMNAPDAGRVLEALKAKYGMPSSWQKKQDGSGGMIVWVFNPDNGESYGNHYPLECLESLKVNGPDWRWVQDQRAMNFSYQALGKPDQKACRYLKVTYSTRGPLLNYLATQLVDIPLIKETIIRLHGKMKQESAQKAQKVREKSKGVETKL